MYTYTLQTIPAFTGTGLEGYSFGPLRQKDVDIYYVESEKGHDTFMKSKTVTRIYYVVSGCGDFTIDRQRYEVGPGTLVEVPPKVEFSYSGKMALIGYARRRRWFAGDDTHTRWNPAVTARRQAAGLPGWQPWLTRVVRFTIAGRSPVGAYMRLNRQLWRRMPDSMRRDGVVRLYGRCVHALARIRGGRVQAFNTCFLRNRPELELIRRLMEGKGSNEIVKVAVVGCSTGPEAYSVAWRIRSTRPDLDLTITGVDISPHAVAVARRGSYSASRANPLSSIVFERMTAEEKNEFFDTDGETAVVKPWIREGMRWRVGDVGEPEIVEALGLQDVVVASNFLCHMVPSEAERCLRNISRLVRPYGYLFVSGIDLEVRTKVALELGWKPVQDLLEEIHEGDPVLRVHWPWHYTGLEPLDKDTPDWRIRYAAAFQIVPDPFVPRGGRGPVFAISDQPTVEKR
jgi:SAM-dependent methyltransferase